jgi:hypothetical protein
VLPPLFSQKIFISSSVAQGAKSGPSVHAATYKERIEDLEEVYFPKIEVVSPNSGQSQAYIRALFCIALKPTQCSLVHGTKG